MTNLLEAALSARRAGVSIVPVELPLKVPPSGKPWKWRQERLPDEATIRADLAGKNGSSGFAIIGGKVSGNTEIIDFDLAGEFSPHFEKLVEAEAPGLLGRLAKQKTLNGGDHFIARCPGATIGRSQKLAHKRIEVDGPGEHEHGGKRYTARQHGGLWFIFPVAIETRGEGGYAVSAPSPGYTITHEGETGDFHNPPDITPTEREILLRCARALDELPPESVEDGPKQKPENVGGLKPGADFNRRGNSLPIILKHNWKRAGGSDEKLHLTRDGKENGISATLYENKILHVFSSNAFPFENDKSYSPFSIYALLEHGGDFTAAARELGRQGYGDPPRAKAEEPRSDPGDQREAPQDPGPDQDPRHEEPPTEPAPGIIRAVLTVGQFMEIKTPPRRFHLDGWLKENSIGMISSPAGFGKTGLAHGILDTVSKGGAFGPWRCDNPAPVGIVDGEMSIHDNRERFELGGLNDDRECPFYIYADSYAYELGLPRARLTDELWQKEIKELCLDLGVKLIAFDNIASLAPGLDENAKVDWDPINQFLIDLRFAGVSSLLIHHDNKTGGQRGTSARTDNLDYVIQLRQPADYMPEDGARFIVHFTKARVENRFLPLVSDVEMRLTQDPGGRYVWTFQNVKAARKREVVRLLDEGLKSAAIAAAVGYSPGQVSKIKTWAVQQGLFSKAGNLTPSGFEWLSKG
jgi:hypothetical protein